jgi:Fe2+ or Zn2+ uptake regulation protein
MRTKEEVQQWVEDNRTPNAALAGEIVTFKTNACGRVSIGRLRNVLDAVGVDPDEASDLLPVSALRRALRKMRENRAVDRVEQTEAEATFQLTAKSLDEEAKQVAYNYEAQLHLNLETGKITCPESPELEQRAQELFEDAQQHREPRDVKTIVKRLFTKRTARDLYSINTENGGSYFVPEKHREFTARMDAFLAELGGRLERFPVPTGTKEGDAAIRESVAQGIERWIQDLDGAVDKWDVSSRDSTHDRYAGLYKEAAFKAEAWGDYLGEKVAEIHRRIEASKSRMRSKITALAAEKEGSTTTDGNTDGTGMDGVREDCQDIEPHEVAATDSVWP